MGDLVTSVARTIASKVVGGVIGWAAGLGIAVPADLSGTATLALTGVLIVAAQIVYYVVARLLERRSSLWGQVLLWSARQPTYEPPGPRGIG